MDAARGYERVQFAGPLRIYGGAFTAGGISNHLYDGCNLATDPIVVSANNRLGVLGFLALPSAGIEGNLGVQDLLLALEWVQENIASFGGDTVCEANSCDWHSRGLEH